jgi:hypothetical protein
MMMTTAHGTGSGSIEYTFGSEPRQLQTVTVTSDSAFNNDNIINAVVLAFNWTDPIHGRCSLLITINPFKGTGTYNSVQTLVGTLLWAEAQSPGNWESGLGFDGVVLNAIYSRTGNLVQWQGSLSAQNIPRQDGGLPPVSLILSALTLTIEDS